MIEITKDSSMFKMKCTKLKDGEEWKGKFFNLQSCSDSKSAYISWVDCLDLDQFQNKQQGETDKDLLMQHMERLNGNGLTASTLSSLHIKKSAPYTTKLLNKMVQARNCKKSLQKPDRIASRCNPNVYYV